MLPLGILNLVAVAVVQEMQHNTAQSSSLTGTLIAVAVGWVVLIGGWMGVAISNPLVTDNRPRRNLSSAEVDAQI
jgi:hypothetical protein